MYTFPNRYRRGSLHVTASIFAKVQYICIAILQYLFTINANLYVQYYKSQPHLYIYSSRRKKFLFHCTKHHFCWHFIAVLFVFCCLSFDLFTKVQCVEKPLAMRVRLCWLNNYEILLFYILVKASPHVQYGNKSTKAWARD